MLISKHRIQFLLSFLCLISTSVVRAEWSLSVFAGKAMTENGELRLKDRATGTDLTFEDVSWAGRSFESPYYYGARLTHWFNQWPNFGMGLDFTHAKAYLQDDEVVNVAGSRNNQVVAGLERIDQTIDSFSMSHGLNFVTLNAYYRWFPTGQRDDSWLGRLQPYVGAGVGFTIPHVETRINGVLEEEYQIAGPAVQSLVGLNYDICKYVSGFVEYKFNFADVDADVVGGRTIKTDTLTHQFLFGLSFNFDI